MALSTATSDASPAAYHRGLFFAAFALVASVFPLIWMGGLVTSHGVGLSVPDWPNSYGHNMFLFPPSKWLGGIFYEHTHRLLGTLSGFLAIWLMLMAWGPARSRPVRIAWTVATVLLWLMTLASGGFAWMAAKQGTLSPGTIKMLPHLAVGFASLALVATVAMFCRTREPRRWVRWLTVWVFIAVCVQGTFGGLRVEKVSLALAIVHGCFAQFFFCLAGFTALVTSKWWLRTTAGGSGTARFSGADESQSLSDRPAEAGRAGSASAGRTAAWLAVITTLVIFAQLIAGALMRHNGASLAVPGVLAYGHLFPPTDHAGLEAANAIRAWEYDPPLEPVTLTKMWMHYAHRIGALLVSICVIGTAGYVFQKFGAKRAAGRVAVILLGLLLTQVTLGVLTVYLMRPAEIATLHVAVGALTLLTSSLAVAVLARQYGLRPARSTITAPAAGLMRGTLVTKA